MNRGWLWILAGGVAETGWATCMKLSNGLTDVVYDVLTVAILILSLVLLNRGFRAGLPTGPCYAVWVGIGAVGSVLMGAIFFGDVLVPAGWLCVFLIVAGVIGINLADVEDRGPASRGCLWSCRTDRYIRPWAPGASRRSILGIFCPLGPSRGSSRTWTRSCR